MLEETVVIINKAGLHARAALKMVELTASFSCDIKVGRDKLVDGKSILALMMLAAVKGTEIRIIVDGRDEKKALAAICELVNNRFGESV
ncbi:MAG: HPr family phosphocarrier protein [Gammaproteobacteria bacterium]|nr:HPr family phosphocarrier protein [Gammaproteobacteria bacterium]